MSRAAAFSIGVWVAGCAAAPLPRARAPEAPTGGLTKCKVAASQLNPLVTEWPASEKANLEVNLREGAVVVAYSGCEMRMLPSCRLGGAYGWQRTTPATDVIEIRSEDDLYAKLPLGAVALAGELRSAGRLSVTTTVSGQLRLSAIAPGKDTAPGACTGATHLVRSITVGTFVLKAGGELAAKAGVEVGPAAGGVSTASAETVVRRAGDEQSCRQATDAEPHPDCRSPIQVFLEPLPWTQPVRMPAELGPPGAVKASFRAADADAVWEVVSDGQLLCNTPCERWLLPTSALLMREKRDDGFFSPGKHMDHEVEVSLRDQAEGRQVAVQAHRARSGLFLSGVVLTALAGAAVAAGAVLLGVGCSDVEARGGLCSAGAVTGGTGVAVLVPSIVLIALSGADAEVVPSEPAGPAAAVWPGRAWFGSHALE
jgi:hypothetical protein